METHPQNRSEDVQQGAMLPPLGNVTRRGFLKRTGGTALVFGLTASALLATPACEYLNVSCPGYTSDCVTVICPAGSIDCQVERDDGTGHTVVPKDGVTYRYGCNKWGDPHYDD